MMKILKIKDKISIGNFFNSLKVVLIRHLNGNEGMFNNLDNVNKLENNNYIISDDCSNEYQSNQSNNGNNGINAIMALNAIMA